ncbi:MAG TPA: Wzz/FepE/Etk N-terminal domain-containing protein, partial [Vicinamibacterales bacterium]|nr:Wzz/FepE/Etk N-terminal domain-containing protein [Vicinamibacterales bacterium]
MTDRQIDSGADPNQPDLDAAFAATQRPHKDRAQELALAASASQPGAGYGGYVPTPADEVHLLDYVRVLHKRRWTALTAFVIVFGSVAIYTFTATPIYSARVQILIENENPNVVKFEEVYDQNKTSIDYYQTQYRILQSRLLARRTLDAQNLWGNPQFAQPAASIWSRFAGWASRSP